MAKRPLYAVARTGLAACAIRLALAAGCLGLAAADAAAQEPVCAACIALDITPGQAALLPPQLDGRDVFVRVPAGGETTAREALAEIARRAGHAGLFISGVLSTTLPGDLVAMADLVLVDLTTTPADDPRQVAFTLKTQSTAVRAGGRPGVRFGIVAAGAAASALLAQDLAPYLDIVLWVDAMPAGTAGPAAWRTYAAPPATLAAALAPTGTPGVERWLWRMPADDQAAGPLMAAVVQAAQALPAGLVPSDRYRVTCGTTVAATYQNPTTLDVVAFASCASEDALSVTPPAPGVQHVRLATGDFIVRVPARTGEDQFAEGVQVIGARSLSVEEIVARHQAAAARQTASVKTLISRGTLTLSFEAPGFPAPVSISSETTLYAGAGVTELEQRAIRVNGIEFRGGGVPRLPIIEPERVASPPLTITLSDVYRYQLAGRETVGKTPCYVVQFEPAGDASLFRGRAWIAMDSFAMVRVAAAQTHLRGPIVASEQTDDFEQVAEGVWLLARSDVRQTYEGASYRTPIHRVLSMTSHEINPPDFTARRQAAMASDNVMLRDTAEGYRYLKRSRPTAAGTVQAEPEVAGRANRVRTLAVGVILDPNISVPLPFAGLSYVDFDLFHTGTQLSVFFGGTYGQLAFSAPSLGGTRWQLAGRAFGIASSYNDRAFVGGREIYAENIRQRPAQASVWLLRSLTPRISVRLGYDLDYTQLARGDLTGPAFMVPANQVVHGARVALDGQRSGWNSSIWWNPAIRTGWHAWGVPGSPESMVAQRDFQRYGASLARSAVLSPRLVARAEGAWMAGRDLDRFSRYTFGTFDNRLRGYPSALIRYDRGAVLRTALAWSAGKLARLDGFVDSAAVHDPGFGRGLRNYTGVGAAAEVPAPFGTLVALEWGYGFRGVNGNGTLGTQVVRISAFKVF
ncbi:MAG: hypothetical protein V7647_1757 [Acidobacteriota bacterium]